MMVIGVAHHTELAVTADFLLYNHIALPCDSTYDGDHLRRLALCIASIYLRSALRRVASVCILLVACVRRAVCLHVLPVPRVSRASAPVGLSEDLQVGPTSSRPIPNMTCDGAAQRHCLS